MNKQYPKGEGAMFANEKQNENESKKKSMGSFQQLCEACQVISPLKRLEMNSPALVRAHGTYARQ